MVKCSFCGATHVPNTVFCRECGTYLLEEEESRSTDPLGTEELGWVGENEEVEEIPPSVQQKPRSIHLEITNSNRVIETPIVDTMLLGRIDPTNDVFPEVDLTDESGLEQGVSRRHAQILNKEGHIMIEDMGSLNGTFINGKRLSPYYPEELHHGDQLQLGKLLIDITLH